MASCHFPFDLVTIFVFFLLCGMTLTSAEEKVNGISFMFPIERTTLQNMDMASILNDVAKTGCWIHFIGNIGNKAKENDTEIQLAAQFGSDSNPMEIAKNQRQNQNPNSGNFLIPILLRDRKKVLTWEYRDYLSDGLSPAARVKHSNCYINIFYWPLDFPTWKGTDDFDDAVIQGMSSMKEQIEYGAFCVSFFQHGGCTQRYFSAIAAKFTVVFLEISKQGNVVLEIENPDSESQNKKGNFPKPFFANPLSDSYLLLPFVAVTIPIPTTKSTAAQETQRKKPMELEISSVWFINHWNVLSNQINPQPPCANPSQKEKLFKNTSCYSNVMSNGIKNNKNKNPGAEASQSKPIESTSKLSVRFKTPGNRLNPANFTATLESFLNSDVLNDTWEGSESFDESWSSQKLRLGIRLATPETPIVGLARLVWIWTGSKNYKFITSDSVYQTKSGLQIYTTPFQKEVWTLLFVSVVIAVSVLLILALVKNPKETSKLSHIWKMLSELCLWILRILLEQPDQEIPPGIQIHQIHQNLFKKGLKRAIRLILGAWLLISVILINAYGGIIKSDYTLDFPFASDPKWNSSTDFLRDGSFFVYYTQMGWKENGEKQNVETRLFKLTETFTFENEYKKPKYLTSRVHHKTEILSSKCQSLCSLENMRLPFEESGCQKFEPCRRLYELELILVRQHLTCTEDLPDLIKSKLRHPKTVFMTMAQDFPVFWNKFKQQMKENPELNMKFVHNSNENDEKVQEIHGFEIDYRDSKVNPQDVDFILSPLKILVSSGIFWWWEKWDQIKFHGDRQIWRNSSEFIDESLAVFKPLSFQDSDIHLVFLIWLLFLILPATAFLFEVFSISKILNRIWFLFQQKKKMLRHPRKERKLQVVQNLVITFPFWVSEEKNLNPTSTHAFKKETTRIVLPRLRKTDNLKEKVTEHLNGKDKKMNHNKEKVDSAPT